MMEAVMEKQLTVYLLRRSGGTSRDCMEIQRVRDEELLGIVYQTSSVGKKSK